MSIFKICKICAVLCIGVLSTNNNIGYTMYGQDNNNRYELIQVIEFDWNTIPIMFEMGPNNYIQGRYIQVCNEYNNYLCDIWSHRIKVYMKIGNKLDYNENEIINKFTELSNNIRANNNWNNLNNAIHNLFGESYTAYLV